ncbi:protein of unknown function DUF1549 [Pirellula staleyi DSM 6068]|uniref:Cytochrome c domain-containing protein n=1 Tax=Pirellula staleyi (strain ATCC 27377 / DSM 6068 / ICPB 4128) TaxID=530564 RepID=D2QWN9_PIRSD|nr:DUF1549 domain-containing protein [Pirellula staleyi]ADB17842.1 protein of unknown function DUF1549 [Pirellula staleyi DSM 6068]
MTSFVEKLRWKFLALLLAAGSLVKANAADEPINFHTQVVPILQSTCIKCHTGREAKGGLRMETREQLMAGGDSGAVVTVGSGEKSLLWQLAAGKEADRIMPAQGPRLTEEQLAIVKRWIDEGATWEEGFRFKSTEPKPLPPRIVELPPMPSGIAGDHPIDRILGHYLESHGIEQSQLVDDRMYLRRVSMDLVGELPSEELAATFLADKAADKRAKLVAQLLADRQAYAEHWLSFWNDHLRNAYRGTGFIDGGRKQITTWLYQALVDNKPYDKFVHELISPVPGSEGFSTGIVWRGTVNASQRPEMQAAQNIGQVFLGTNLKCASCHDSFVNHWKLTDAYGLAAVFAEKDLEIHRCDKPTGETATPGFVYPQLGAISSQLPRAERMKQLADLMVHPENGRLARVMVNRLWSQLMGRGIVEPLDDLDQDPWSSDLLDWLAVDLANHGYDLKHTLALICTSRAYQMPAVDAPKAEEAEYLFRGPIVRRMSAEQFVDAAAVLTASRPAKPAIDLPVVNDDGAKPADIKFAGRWIWNDRLAVDAAEGGRIYLRKTFELKSAVKRAFAVVSCDNQFELFVGGKKVASGNVWNEPTVVEITRDLAVGSNTVAAIAINWPDVEGNNGTEIKGKNPAGFVASLAIELDSGKWLNIGSDPSWLVASAKPEGDWTSPSYDDKGWSKAAQVAPIDGVPWRLANTLQERAQQVAGTRAFAQVRAAVVNDDALMRALGRPNREQVVTRRDSVATTLQALELTNGSTLDDMLTRGAKHWLTQEKTSPEMLVTRIYEQAVGRAPTTSEREIAVTVMGNQPDVNGVKDLLWIVLMLPEFQLVY